MSARAGEPGSCTHHLPQRTATARCFERQPEHERPLNVYGYSKLLFDNIVRRVLPTARFQVAGFRYFNVYGPRERHKGRMARWRATISGSCARAGR